jgi:outer membrane protein assembly factor BamB
MRTRITPRLGAPPAGAVVNVPGLPRLLIVTEGERHLVAIDLASGELRWRYAWGRGGALRMKRAGRLLYVASGDSALTALDVQTGAVVWRVRNRLRFRTTPVLAHDSLVALAGGAHSFAEIVAIDPFSGHLRWKKPLSETPCTVEGGPLVAADVVAASVRDRHGLKLSAFDLASGKSVWSSERPVAPVGTSWLALDDLLVGNSPTGELVAIEAATGELRYRHILGVVLESDVPRRLEPVLRAGALFVPHVDVHVFRPGDGACVATIGPCEAIPDLVRVDEKCNVFVAEESGHLVAFGAGPRLTLVK